MLDEYKKIIKSKGFLKLFKDPFCQEIIQLIFPQFKNLSIFGNLNSFAKDNIDNVDFIFLISLMIIDGSDNVDYFIYKFMILLHNNYHQIIFCIWKPFFLLGVLLLTQMIRL